MESHSSVLKSFLAQRTHLYAYSFPLVSSASRNVHAVSALRTEPLPSIQRHSSRYVPTSERPVPSKPDLCAAPAQQWAEAAVENLSVLSRPIIKGKKTEQASDQNRGSAGAKDLSILYIGGPADRYSMLARRTTVHGLVRTFYAVICRRVQRDNLAFQAK
jgi:hypothetical protein